MKYLKPDREEFKEVILRRKIPSRVHFVELHIDAEVIRYFTKKMESKVDRALSSKG